MFSGGLHDAKRIPKNGIGVEVFGGVEPKIELLLSVSFSLSEDVGVKNIRVSTKVTKELKIYFIMRWSQRR